ncbi:hypothetical protein B0T25DRAFT_554405 [Lasiosphaeria hispida]|uniref:Uncharacterized protein n=1 Tax=Lasiosphaeria hispida TaxID=260671 RepID=A0AAJ0H7Z3_9PEZI|nr:hypothetical protein B0T25DRAFT_554405 [Lasiosphaeria hispida]
MGGLEMWHHSPGSLPVLRTLSPNGVRKLAAANPTPLKIPVSTIEDRSKADTIQKGLVLLQVAWMALQCITRKALGLPLTLLELHTMVHVVCAMVMYAFWFEKPLDLRNAELLNHADFGDVALDEHTDFYPRRGNMPEYKLSWVLRGNVKEMFGSSNSLLTALLFVLPLVYGGVHLSAWGFEFPTPAEGACWKAACVFIALALVVWWLVHWVCLFAELVLLHLCGLDLEYFTDWNLIVTGRVFFFVCMLCRLYIVMEAFVSLRAVPIGVYWTPSWIQTIPHV